MESRCGDAIPVEDLVRSALQGPPKEEWDYEKQETAPEDQEKCANCRFAAPMHHVTEDGVRVQAEVAYECRLFPPVPTIEVFSGFHTEWSYPRVHGEAWCGQYEPQRDR